MPDIVITEFMDQSAVDELSSRFDVVYSPDLVDRSADLAATLSEARAIIVRNRTQVRQTLLDSAPRLRAVGRLGVGLDNIDTDACQQKGITVYPATGANDVAVAEYVIATALILSRNAYHATVQVINGDWPRQNCIGREIQGQVLGLIGCGNIAREVAYRALALGMNMIGYDPYLSADDNVWSKIKRVESIAELLAHADIVSLHVPLTDTTRHLIDASALNKIKPGAVIINTARGGVIDEAALVEAIKTGQVGGAAIDVFANEPVDQSRGQLFAGVPNLWLTPHIAGVTEQSNVRVSSLIAKKITEHLDAL